MIAAVKVAPERNAAGRNRNDFRIVEFGKLWYDEDGICFRL